MKTLAKYMSVLVVTLFLSFNAYAGKGWDGGDKGWDGNPEVPEMDAGMAIMGASFLAGAIALFAERRKR